MRWYDKDMIGNATDAALALTHPSELKIGEGSSRSAYLINGVVYKVQHEMSYADNEIEHGNMGAMIATGTQTFSVPLTDMHGNVLAMEYIDGQLTGFCMDCEDGNFHLCVDSCVSQEVANELAMFNIIDLVYGNLVWLNDVPWIIDAAV